MTRKTSLQRWMVAAAVLVPGICSLVVAQAVAQVPPSSIGAWSTVYDWPNKAIHTNLLPDGKILSWAQGANGYLGTVTVAHIITIPAGDAPGTVVQVNNNSSNMFCSGHTFLPDGRLLVTGGQSVKQSTGQSDVDVFDQAGGNLWQTYRFPMEYARWYATALSLANGDVLFLAGNRTSGKDPNTLPQVWQGDGVLHDLSTAVLKVANYSKTFVAPNGKVFLAGPAKVSSFLDTSGSGAWLPGPTHKFVPRYDGTAVMYDDGKILVTAGGLRGQLPLRSAETIDLNSATPNWNIAAGMVYPRRHANATLLPDGKVLVTGGSNASENNNAIGAILPAEMWDPVTNTWTTMASLTIPRVYHSMAILLADGRVLAGGGDRPTGSAFSSHRNVQIYSPPYLFKGGVRPVITSAPKNLGYGQQFSVTSPQAGDISKMTLLRLGSVTHSFNMNQRIKFLQFSRDGETLTATLPSDRQLLLPGNYMLFILDGAGVPSVAAMVSVG